MTPVRVSVSKAIKVGVGRYESVDVTVSLTLDLDKGDKPDLAATSAAKWCDARLNEHLEDLQDILKPDSVFLITKRPVNKKKGA